MAEQCGDTKVVTRRGAKAANAPAALTEAQLDEQENALRQLRMFLRDLVTQLLRCASSVMRDRIVSRTCPIRELVSRKGC